MKSGTTLWVVGQIDPSNQLPDGKSSQPWDFVGVFDTEVKAVGACRDWTYFVGACRLNDAFPHEPVEWEGAYYPRAAELN